MFLDKIINKLERIPKSEIIKKAAAKNRRFAEDLQRDQLKEGVDPKNSPITPLYSENYKRFKKSKGLQTKVVDLKLTGKFHREIFQTDEGVGYSFESRDEKTPKLVTKYGLFFGHTKESVGKYSEKIRPDLGTELKEYLTR